MERKVKLGAEETETMTRQKQIENMILSSLEKNIYKQGDKLTSVRKMARINNVSVTTVLAAYRSLENIGVLEARPKSGYYIAQQSPVKARQEPRSYQSYDFESDAQSQIYYYSSEPNFDDSIRYRYSSVYLPAHLSNSQLLFESMSKAMLGYRHRADSVCLRNNVAALTRSLSERMLNIKCIINPDEFRFSFGFVQTLILALQACVSVGDTVAVECPGSCDFFFAAKLYGVKVLPIRSDPQTGLDLDELEYAVRKNASVRGLICSPNFSEPTCSLMPPESKRRLAEFCKEQDIAIIEAELAGDYSFNTPRPLPIKSMAPEQVIYIGGIEQALTNIYFCAGGKYHKKLSSLAEIARLTVPAVLQEGLALYLQSFDAKYLEVLNRQLKKSSQEVCRAVEESFPDGTRVSYPYGGLHVWVELPKSYDTVKLLPLALKENISYSIGHMSSPGLMFRSSLRLNHAEAANRALKLKGIYLLGKLFCENPM